MVQGFFLDVLTSFSLVSGKFLPDDPFNNLGSEKSPAGSDMIPYKKIPYNLTQYNTTVQRHRTTTTTNWKALQLKKGKTAAKIFNLQKQNRPTTTATWHSLQKTSQNSADVLECDHSNEML